MTKDDKEFETLNKKYMDIFIDKGGIGYMMQAFDTLVTYDNIKTRKLFKGELQQSLMESGPFAVVQLLKSFKEIVGSTGYHIPINTSTSFGKIHTSFAIPPLTSYIEKCISVGTMKIEEVEFDLLSTKMVDKDDAKKISDKIKFKFGINGK